MLASEVSRRQRDGRPLAVLLADLDHFKRINDTFGHLAGDAVLRAAARRIRGALRPYDALGRYGGEELLVVLPACDLAGAREAAERVRAAIAAGPVPTDYGDIDVTASIGVAVLEGDAVLAVDSLLQEADRALYRAKHAGRNRVDVAE